MNVLFTRLVGRMVNRSGGLQHTSEDDYVAGKRLELLAHDVEHHAPHRIVREEEARVDGSLVVFNAARHERGESEVTVWG